METRTKVIDHVLGSTSHGVVLYGYSQEVFQGKPVRENWRHHNNAVRIVKSALTLDLAESLNDIIGAIWGHELTSEEIAAKQDLVTAAASAWNFANKDAINAPYSALVIDPSTFQYEAALARSIPEMTPTLDTGFSLANFILELKDLKFLYKNWIPKKGRLKRLENLDKAFRPQRAFFGRKYNPVGSPMNELWKYVSDLHLEWAFGLKPFIQDVATILDKLQHTQERINDFFSKSGSVQKHHYKEDVSPLQADRSTEMPDFLGLPTRISMFASNSVSEYRVSAKVTYKLLDTDIWWTTVQGWLDSFGLNLNSGIIWNAIPFSFVLDWFLNIGDVLDSMKVTNLKLECKIWDLCHSLRITSFGSIDIFIDGAWYSIGTAFVQYYERMPTTFPKGKVVPRVSGFSPSEILLAQSLVATRRRARKRRVRLG